MIRTVICLATGLTIATPALADHRPGHHVPPGHLNGAVRPLPPSNVSGAAVSVQIPGIQFSIADRDAAIAYYRSNRSLFQPVEALPPGIARQVARGRGLPPGIARRAAPAGLIGVLSPVPDGFGLVIAGDDQLVLLHIASDVIYDVVNLLGD